MSSTAMLLEFTEGVPHNVWEGMCLEEQVAVLLRGLTRTLEHMPPYVQVWENVHCVSDEQEEDKTPLQILLDSGCYVIHCTPKEIEDKSEYMSRFENEDDIQTLEEHLTLDDLWDCRLNHESPSRPIIEILLQEERYKSFRNLVRIIELTKSQDYIKEIGSQDYIKEIMEARERLTGLITSENEHG